MNDPLVSRASEAVRAMVPPLIGCVILAAGGSRRLGQPKQLLELQGEPLVVRTVRAVLAVESIWPVVVVLGAHAACIKSSLAPYPVLFAENPAWTEGLASSLRVGLDNLQRFSRDVSAALFTLCDQPLLDTTTLTELIQTRRSSGKSVVSASYNGHPGAPALIDRRHFPALAQLVGDDGARRLVQSLPASAVALVAAPQLAHDIDTPEDWARVGKLDLNPTDPLRD